MVFDRLTLAVGSVAITYPFNSSLATVVGLANKQTLCVVGYGEILHYWPGKAQSSQIDIECSAQERIEA
jgi:hypothetical protein